MKKNVTKSSYDQYTDEELIGQLREGEFCIVDYIMEKYKNLVRNKAKSMYILGADSEDLIQEGMIGLFKAIRDYDSGRDASFATFADLCVSRQMYTAVQSARRKKHVPLNTYVSLYGMSDRKEETNLIDSLVSKIDLNPEEILIDRENAETLTKEIEKELSAFENQVLDLYLTGMGYIQIAKVLGKDEKSTDNALCRIKNKVKKLISNKGKINSL